MKLEEAKKAYENGMMVQHKEGNTSDFISCFDDEETGVYLKHSYLFIPLKNLIYSVNR